MTVGPPTEPAWFGCRSVSTVTSRTCGEPGWGQVAWQPARPPAGTADHRAGALGNSSIRTGRGNKRSPLQAKQRVWGSAHVFSPPCPCWRAEEQTDQGRWRRFSSTCGRWWSRGSLQWRWWVDPPPAGPCGSPITWPRKRGKPQHQGLCLYQSTNPAPIMLPLYLSRWKAAISALCLSKSEK